jgi:hypothetical protein
MRRVLAIAFTSTRCDSRFSIVRREPRFVGCASGPYASDPDVRMITVIGESVIDAYRAVSLRRKRD